MALSASAPAGPARIWYQSFVDPVEQQPYISRLQALLDQYAAPGIHFEVHGITPPDRYLSPLTEYRCAGSAIRNAIEAQRTGCAAFAMGHFQEPGLLECRTAVDIPVLGLGEATMLHALTLGRTFGLVTINAAFTPWLRDQIFHLGVQARSVGVRALDTQVATYMRAYDDESAYRAVKEAFCREAGVLVEAGAEVIIPAGGLPMLLFARERGFEIEGAPVVNGIAVLVAAAEAAIKLQGLTGAAISRRGTYAKAPPEAVAEFLGSVPAAQSTPSSD
jgi:allantoin racemase